MPGWMPAAALGVALLLAQTAAATIYNWQTGQPISGTEGITPQPFVNLSYWNTASHNLRYGDFRSTDLNHSNFGYSWLDCAHFGGADLTSADLSSAMLTSANLSDANLTWAGLCRATLTGADLTSANLYQATVTGADLILANLESATLTGANLTLADTRKAQGASLGEAVTRNTILPDGTVAGLTLLASDTLVVRNCDLGITVQAAMTFDPSAVIEFRLENGVWGSTVTPAPAVVPDLGGTLQLRFADGVDPALLVGKTFDLFDWSGPLEADNRFDGVRSEPGVLWGLRALYTTGEVTLVPEPATLSLLALGGLALLRRRRVASA